MADSIELRTSINSLKRIDPYVKNVLATATQVALYKFNNDSSVWEKAEKEGALFLYSRNGEPLHSLMIFNRLNKDNFIEPIISDFDYQVQIPFLLYRSKRKIYGIWFFNQDECIRVATLIDSLMDKDKICNDNPLPQNGSNNKDIFSMLSKAQDDFTRTPSKPEAPKVSASTPRALDVASQSVIDFFAKASTKGSAQKPAATSSGGNVLHRLMSNPVHSVEHIEKQQRSTTPTANQTDNSLIIERSNQSQNAFHLLVRRSNQSHSEKQPPDEKVLHSFEQQRSITPQELMAAAAERKSIPINLPKTMKKLELFDHNGISPPQQNIASSPLAYLMQNQPLSVNDNVESGTSPFQKFLESAHKPTLMTPMMFSSVDNNKPLEVLTEKQLAQALTHLLKTDKEFVKKIHQAYIDSILDKP